MNLKKLLPVASMVSILGVLANVSPALAAVPVTCTVTDVAWTSEVGGGELQVYCGGNWYYADVSTATCSATGANTRTWLSMAQSAYLSGRLATMRYTTNGCAVGDPGCNPCVFYFQLN